MSNYCRVCGADEDSADLVCYTCSIKTKKEKKTYQDMSLINFFQLSSGKWSGHTLSGVYVTIHTFPQGESCGRMKYQTLNKASKEEAEEYWKLHEPISKAREEEARMRDEIAYSEGYTSYDSMMNYLYNLD